MRIDEKKSNLQELRDLNGNKLQLNTKFGNCLTGLIKPRE